MGRWLRDIRTTQERRSWFSFIMSMSDYPQWIKRRRSNKHVPNSWDDIIRSDLYDRSWKLNRKTQYKNKNE